MVQRDKESSGLGDDHIIPIGVLTPLFPLHFRLEAHEDVIKQIRISEAQSTVLKLIFAGW